MNTHLACLYTASKRLSSALHPMLVNPDDLIHLHGPDTFSAGGIVATTQILRANWTTTNGPPPKNDWRLLRATTVDLNAVTQSYDQLNKVLSADSADQLLPLVDAALRASVAHSAKAWDAALVQSWAAIERLLTGIWETYVAENRERLRDGQQRVFIDADRKKQLLSGRDYTISVVSEILSLLDVLPDDIYRRLKPVGKLAMDGCINWSRSRRTHPHNRSRSRLTCYATSTESTWTRCRVLCSRVGCNCVGDLDLNKGG